MNQKTIVAGAGLWGCTIARRLADAGKKVLLLDQREAIGGNCRCQTDSKTGIEVHLYGCHIFHTHIQTVWDFVHRFTSFNGYQHHGMSYYNGKMYNLPLGLSLINKFFGVELKPSEVKAFMAEGDHEVAVFDAFFRGYTSKQWGRRPEDVDPTVIKRIPVRLNYDINYYSDYWQGIPINGYNEFFRRLVDHPNIEIRCGVPFELNDLKKKIGEQIFYSGPIDRLFGYCFGALPWRSLRFETETVNSVDWQGTSVVNYPELTYAYTRIHEFKHFHPENSRVMSCDKTIITREYPMNWNMGDEPYYPINDRASENLLRRYQDLGKSYPNLVIGGRLGEYRYYDMDKTIEAALKVQL